MAEVACDTLFNETRYVPRERMAFRPSVYGFVKHGDRILLIRTSATGAYEFPGGGIEPGERMEDALRREVLEEAGIDVSVQRFLLFKETFFYHDLEKKAYHSLQFFYECTPLQDILLEAHVDADGTVTEEPLWVATSTLSEQDFRGSDKGFFGEFKRNGIL